MYVTEPRYNEILVYIYLHMYLSTDPLYALCLLLVLLTSLLITNVVRSDPEMLGSAT